MEKFKKVVSVVLKALKDNVVKIILGAIIGAGGVLPGVSGGVLAVLFGLYLPLMRFLAHPIKNFKQSMIELWPILLGYVIGYVGIAKVLGAVLEAYETQSLALFVGMAIGIMPSLFREAGEKGRNRNSWISMGVVFAVAFTILYTCTYVLEFTIKPNFAWNMFGGVCLALSIIAPGLSGSTLMLPLKALGAGGATITFYTHITGTIGDVLGSPDLLALFAIVLGAVAAVVTLSKGIDWLMNNHYSVTFHGIIGLVTASTVLTIPFGAFTSSVGSCLLHLAFVVVGCICTLLLDKFNSKVEKPPVKDSEEESRKA